MDVYNLVYLLFTCLNYYCAHGRISFCIAHYYVFRLLWCIWTYIMSYSLLLGVWITVVHMDVYFFFVYHHYVHHLV